MKTLTRALARGLVAGALPILLLWLADGQDGADQGADIGGGFMLLAALIVIPFVWACRDAAAHGSRRAIVVWCLAAVMPWLVDALRIFVGNDGSSPGDALGSLAAALFLVPFFVVAALVGSLVGGSRHAVCARQGGDEA